MCRGCVGSELSPAPGSIYKSDNARKLSADSTLWHAEVIPENPEGKQYKNLKAEWYDMILLFVTLALSVGNSRCCFVWILFATEFPLQWFLLPCCLRHILWTLDFLSITPQRDSLIQISVWFCWIQKSTIKKRGTISIHFNKFIKIWDACVCSNQHWEMAPLKINIKKLTVQFPKLVYFSFSLKHTFF